MLFLFLGTYYSLLLQGRVSAKIFAIGGYGERVPKRTGGDKQPVLNELVVERNEPTERYFSEEDLNEVRR